MVVMMIIDWYADDGGIWVDDVVDCDYSQGLYFTWRGSACYESLWINICQFVCLFVCPATENETNREALQYRAMTIEFAYFVCCVIYN